MAQTKSTGLSLEWLTVGPSRPTDRPYVPTLRHSTIHSARFSVAGSRKKLAGLLLGGLRSPSPKTLFFPSALLSSFPFHSRTFSDASAASPQPLLPPWPAPPLGARSTRAGFQSVAVIANVDHGKTALMDRHLRQCVADIPHERALDSISLGCERRITIASKARNHKHWFLRSSESAFIKFPRTGGRSISWPESCFRVQCTITFELERL